MIRQEQHVDFPESESEKERQALLLRNLYRSFVDNTFEIIFRSSAGDKVEFSNKLFVETFGFSDYQHAKGFPVEDLFESKDDYVLLKESILHEGKIRHKQIHFKTLSGKFFVVLLNVHTQANEKGQTVFLWAMLDMTERLQFEQSLEQKTQQLTKINNQMEKFLYSTSHDLRAPISSIMGLVNLMRMDSTEKRILDYIGRIESSALQLDKIIQDIISFSKTTYKHIHTEKVDFGIILDKIIGSNQSIQHFDRINKEIVITGESAFYSDIDRLEIILNNVIGNAIRFSDVNKVYPFMRIRVVITPTEAVIEVHDNGIGIARAYLEQIFGMFFKASHQSKGAGLGLYIAKESADQLGGRITVQSEVGFGSLFRIIIPNGVKGKLISRKERLRNQ